MNTFLNHVDEITTEKLTENGALSYSSSLSSLVDLFALGGAYRSRSVNEIHILVLQAYREDPELTLKCLFYLRDIRGGQGERRFFREGLKVLLDTANLSEEQQFLLAGLIPKYGRWDDVIYFWDYFSFSTIIVKQLALDIMDPTNASLLAKWMPSINASSKETKKMGRKIAKTIGLTEKEYRQVLSNLRKHLNLVEQKMSKNNWSDIKYESVPSQAMKRYKTAFYRHDEDRMDAYLDAVKSGKKKINTSTLAPYQIFHEILTKASTANDTKALDTLWNNLPDYVPKNQKAIVVADTSGSMSNPDYVPISVSLSLALYFAERNTGPFENAFITFSANPKLQKISTDLNLEGKLHSMSSADWEFNTDINAVFDLLLQTAKSNKVDEEDMPQTVYIISDMEFDIAIQGKTNFQFAKEKFEEAGYTLPNIVFWNAAARNDTLPVRFDENGVALVSGTSPSIFKMAVENTTPEEFMLKVLNSERYKDVKVIDK